MTFYRTTIKSIYYNSIVIFLFTGIYGNQEHQPFLLKIKIQLFIQEIWELESDLVEKVCMFYSTMQTLNEVVSQNSNSLI